VKVNLGKKVTAQFSLVSIFTVRITSKSFLCAVRCAQKRDCPNFRLRPLSYLSNSTLHSAGAAQSHRYGSNAAYRAIYWREAD